MNTHKSKRQLSSIKIDAAPTKERRRQQGGVRTEVIVQDKHGKALMHRYRAVWECPLDVYKDKKIITEPEYQSGLRFREAYHRSVLSRRAGYERLNNFPNDMRLTPGERLVKDAYRILSSHHMGAVIAICGHGQPAKDEQELKVLRGSLGRLARCWQLAAAAVTRPVCWIAGGQ